MKEYPKPTVQQSIDAWRLIIDLVNDPGYPHNWQCEAVHIRSYMRDITAIVKRAWNIINKESESNDS